ncbi:MAG TPA: FliM/FliN family flagellar motor switch protein [Gaiellaceae bacterium]|nr:FliM/FliN family flagellar motor switch protein [Gaiellaceae bacterium]
MTDLPIEEPEDGAEPIAEPVEEYTPGPVAGFSAEPVEEYTPEPVADFSAEPVEEYTPEPVAEAGVAFAEAGPDFAAEQAAPSAAAEPATRSVSVHNIVVRVGAELGRATLPLAKAVGLAPGSVVELDRAADDPIDLYVNGRRFATGQLLLVDQNEWAIRIEHVLDVHPAEYAPGLDLI